MIKFLTQDRDRIIVINDFCDFDVSIENDENNNFIIVLTVSCINAEFDSEYQLGTYKNERAKEVFNLIVEYLAEVSVGFGSFFKMPPE